MTVAFISHHSGQHDTARAIKSALERAGMSGWLAPDDINPGVTFDEAIMAQIGRSDFVILLLCEGSDRSRHVKRELMIAEEAGKPIYPVRLEPIAPQGLAYWLKDYQWIDWFDRDPASADRLIAAITRRSADAPAAMPIVAPAAPARRKWPLAAGALMLIAAAALAGWWFWSRGGGGADDYVIAPGRWIARRDVTQVVYPEMPPELARQIEETVENDPNPEECIPEEVARRPDVKLFDPGNAGHCTLTSFEMANGRLSGYLSCPLPGTNDGSVMQVTFRGTYSRTSVETDNDITISRPGNLMRLRSRDTSQWLSRDCAAEQR